MAYVNGPQSPDDTRKYAHSINGDGVVEWKQIGFQELDFGAVFGGKTTSTTSNSISFGVKTFTLDTDDGKIVPGNTLQFTSPDRDCFMYGKVLEKDTSDEPALITVAITTISETTGTFQEWEIQIVEVSRKTSIEMTDADLELGDEHSTVFITDDFTAPRTLTLSPGDFLVRGDTVTIYDASGVGAVSKTNPLTVEDQGGNLIAFITNIWFAVNIVWSGTNWASTGAQGYFASTGAGGVPLFIEGYDDTNQAGPGVRVYKNTVSPAASDAIGYIAFDGPSSTQDYVGYSGVYGAIIDPTDGSEDGALAFATTIAGTSAWRVVVGNGMYTNLATGGDKGADTINAKDFYDDGVNINTIYQAKDDGLTNIAAMTGVGFACRTSILDTWTARSLVAGQNISITNPTGAGGDATIALDTVLAAGTYTPTLTNGTNVAASTAVVCYYHRIGSIVTVHGACSVDPTATGASVLGISLPIASNFASAAQLRGLMSSGSTAETGTISADPTNDRAQLDFIAVQTANHTIGFTFSYSIV